MEFIVCFQSLSVATSWQPATDTGIGWEEHLEENNMSCCGLMKLSQTNNSTFSREVITGILPIHEWFNPNSRSRFAVSVAGASPPGRKHMGKSIWLGVTVVTSFTGDCPLLKCTDVSLCGQNRAGKIVKVSYNNDKTQSFQWRAELLFSFFMYLLVILFSSSVY